MGKVLPKLAEALNTLKGALANHKVILVPDVTLGPIKATLLQAEAMVATLHIVASGGAPFPADSVPSVTKAVNDASKDLKAVFKVLGRSA